MTKLAYFKLDTTHADFQAALGKLRADFALVFPANELSINTNKDGTQAWVKGCADTQVGAALLDQVPVEDVADVQAEVSAEAWTGVSPDQVLFRGPLKG